MVFRVSGFDRFPLFERVLPSDTESAEILGGDTFSPFDTESVCEKTNRDSDSFEDFKNIDGDGKQGKYTIFESTLLCFDRTDLTV